METRAEITNISYNEEGDLLVTLEIPKRHKQELKEMSTVTAKLTPYREKRSLDANAYAWVLMGKLAAKTRLPTTEIYRAYIREIGDASTVACVKTKHAEKMKRLWETRGLGWQAETFDSKIPGCTNMIFYQGSSSFDTAQMRQLIDLIKQDCDEQGIETDTPEEIAIRIERWKQYE